MIASILPELFDLITRLDRRNPRLAFLNPKYDNESILTPPVSLCRGWASSPAQTLIFSTLISWHRRRLQENPSKGIILNKDPKGVFASEDQDHSPSEKPFRPHEGFEEEIFIDACRRNSKEGVFCDCDKLEVDTIPEIQFSKPTLEKKRKRAESMIPLTKVKKMKVEEVKENAGDPCLFSCEFGHEEIGRRRQIQIFVLRWEKKI
ncbi:hypothetical protein MA16_Dca013001 [Dendrobium catenatum]|uniref:Uncharacterized protein n=1 Tax=Dendrobium catenatum TaxID=906689 RepID=A0A2I0VUR1_9ASPA|nr:hypothetical protein MA16_Dca013001 [Dendrobium catenatum]